MDILGTLYTVYNVITATLGIAFSIPFGIGWALQTVFYVGLIWFAYRHTPAWLGRVLREKVAPHTSYLTRGLRKVLIRILADPEWLSAKQTAEASVKYIEVPIKRSLKSNIFLRARWLFGGGLLVIGFQNRSLWSPWFWSLLPL